MEDSSNEKNKLEEDISTIISSYRSAGRYSVVVEPKIIKLDFNRIDLVYEINEGSITKITDINFIGNQNYSDRVLRSVISTSRSTWIDKIWGTGRSYDNAIMEYDKELLAQFYRDNGYINFNVVNAIGELNNSSGNFVITFTVDEGERYHFGDVSILNQLDDTYTSLVAGLITTNVDNYYDESEINHNKTNLVDFMKANGLPFATVDVIEEIDFNAGKAKLDGENKVLKLSESVEIYFNDFFLKADEINLDSSKEILSGKNISFDLIDRNAYGKADEILIQKDKAQFKGVEMSLCPCKKRIWWVETDELSFSSQEDFGNFQGGRFYIYDTPIFILPAGKFPLTTEKRSGILLPELSYSNKNGFDLEIPYYLNLASNYDMTISPRYIEERGLAFSSNLRYLTKSSSGSFNFSSLFNDVNYERLFNTDSNRWGISFKHAGETVSYTHLTLPTKA